MSDINFLKNYFESLKGLLKNDEYLDNLVKVKKILIETNSKGKKTMIFGNGGSAAISSHFSVDLTKNARVRCTNYNESDLLTCFANDFGYEKWIEETLKIYLNKKDLVILISSSGNSKNMINAAKYCIKKKIKLITLTGFSKKNPLKTLNKNKNSNFWINSKNYNFVENLHQIILLSAIDKLSNNKF